MATAALHTAVGLVLYWGGVSTIGRNGVIAAVPDFGDSATAFWFLIFGLMFAWLGWMARSFGREIGTYPPRFGWQLIAFGLLGGLLMPVSGFWIAVAIGLLVNFRTNQPLKMN